MTEHQSGTSQSSEFAELLSNEVVMQDNAEVKIRLDRILSIFKNDFASLRNNILNLQRNNKATLIVVDKENPIVTDAEKTISEGGAKYLRNNELIPYYRPTDVLYFRCNLSELKRAKNEIVPNAGMLVDLFDRGDAATLKIAGHSPIELSGDRKVIVSFFYNSQDRKAWKTYDDIKKETGLKDTHTIRQAIIKINERVVRVSGRQLIEARPGEDDRAPKQYRWSIT